MNHGSLFSGIGGFDLAAEWMGWKNIFHCEKDKKARQVLHKHFPNSNSHEDIYKLDALQYEGQIDILTGGFPCQPFSLAGKRKGTNDDRYLWPEMLRVIREIKPTFVVGENVFGLTNMENGKTFDDIWSSLENEGYSVEPFILPAAAVQAWHRRNRVWIIAYTNYSNERRTSRRLQEKNGQIELQKQQQMVQSRVTSKTRISTNPYGKRQQTRCKRKISTKKKLINESSNEDKSKIWCSEPRVGRVADGVPNRVDRLKQLGNAIVPQVAYEIFKVIQQLKNEKKHIHI